MRWILMIALLMTTCVSMAQKKDKKKKSEREVFTYVEQMPQFPGDMFNFFATHIIYPAKAMNDGTEGKVYVKFIVLETGELDDIRVERGISKELDEEAIRVIKLMPKWNPGESNGKKVAVSLMVPVNFVISN